MAEILGSTNLRYDTQHERCALDVFRPAADRHSPLVILIHGGGWIGGDRNQYHQSCVELANQGFAAATIGYRLLADANLDEIAYDVLRGMAHLSKHGSELGIDASRAVTLGSSAGGHLALVTQAFAARWVAEGVVPSAPDVIGTVAQCPVTVLPQAGSPESIKKSLGDYRLEELSPRHMDPKLFRSVLVIHGDKDTVIPLEQVQEFTERLSSAGVDARLEVLPDVEHAFGYRLNRPAAQEAMSLTLPYLQRMLQ